MGIVINGTFDDCIDPWTYTGGVAKHAPTSGHAANGSANITQTGSASTFLYQNISNTTALINGSIYRFEAWLYVPSGQNVGDGKSVGGFLSIGEGTSTFEKRVKYNVSAEINTTDAWVNVSANFVYDNSTDLFVGLYTNGSNASGDGFAYWDEALISNTTGSANGAVTCGNLGSSSTMTGNLTSNGTCVVITANSIRFDCAGYSITGNGTGIGINVTSYDSVILDNCSVSNFSYNILLFKATNPLISNTTLFDFHSYNSTNLTVDLPETNCSYAFQGVRIERPGDWTNCRFNLTTSHGGYVKVTSFYARNLPTEMLYAFGTLGLGGLFAVLRRVYRRRRRR